METNELSQGVGGRAGSVVGVTHFIDFPVSAINSGHQELRGQVEGAQSESLVLGDRHATGTLRRQRGNDFDLGDTCRLKQHRLHIVEIVLARYVLDDGPGEQIAEVRVVVDCSRVKIQFSPVHIPGNIKLRHRMAEIKVQRDLPHRICWIET